MTQKNTRLYYVINGSRIAELLGEIEGVKSFYDEDLGHIKIRENEHTTVEALADVVTENILDEFDDWKNYKLFYNEFHKCDSCEKFCFIVYSINRSDFFCANCGRQKEAFHSETKSFIHFKKNNIYESKPELLPHIDANLTKLVLDYEEEVLHEK